MAQPKRILDVRVPWADPQMDQLAYVPCISCGRFDYEVKASLVIGWVEFFIVQCTRCRLMWRNPLPGISFLTDLYTENYFDTSRYPPALVHQVGIADSREIDRAYRREKAEGEVRSWIRRGLDPIDSEGRPRKLLEIGGGRGYLQAAAADCGWSTLGLEISTYGIRESIHRALPVLPIVLDELCAKYIPYVKFFDLVVLFDFLEHVTDPGRVLRMVHSILKDDGTIILRVPCINDDECPAFHLIDHIWHFSKETMEALLGREGFVVTELALTGRFPGPDGQVQNVTLFARKTGAASGAVAKEASGCADPR